MNSIQPKYSINESKCIQVRNHMEYEFTLRENLNMIELKIRDRYKNFRQIYKKLLEIYPDEFVNVQFPPKKYFFNMNSDFVEGRKMRLSKFLEYILSNSKIDQFPLIDKFIQDKLISIEFINNGSSANRELIEAMKNFFQDGEINVNQFFSKIDPPNFSNFLRTKDLKLILQQMNPSSNQLLISQEKVKKINSDPSKIGKNIVQESNEIVDIYNKNLFDINVCEISVDAEDIEHSTKAIKNQLNKTKKLENLNSPFLFEIKGKNLSVDVPIKESKLEFLQILELATKQIEYIILNKEESVLKNRSFLVSY